MFMELKLQNPQFVLWQLQTYSNKSSSMILILLFMNLSDSAVADLILPTSSTSRPASTTSMWVRYGTGISGGVGGVE